MKKIYLLLALFSICLITTEVKADSLFTTPFENECDVSDPHDAIDLQGLLGVPVTRSLIKPIVAFKESSSIQVNFASTLGTITTTVYDESGNVVYQQSVNTFVVQQVNISTTTLDSGTYTIVFVNAQDQYLSGTFEI